MEKTVVSNNNKPYQLASATVYPDRNLIIRGGVEFKLPAKSFNILTVLLNGKGFSVSRDEILNSVWGEQLGSDELLNNGVSKLRNALGRFNESKQIIETVPKHGYRLSIQPNSVSPKGNGDYLHRPTVKYMYWIVGLFAIAMSYNYWGTKDSKPNKNEIRYNISIKEITKLRGIEAWPAFSPNGKTLAFSMVKVFSTQADLYLQNISSGDVRRLTNDLPHEHFMSWDKTGQYIAYVGVKDNYCKINVFDTRTNQLNEVMDCVNNWPRSLSWSPNGDYLIASWRNQRSDSYHMVQINWRTGETSELFQPSTRYGDLFPVYSPSGRYLAWNRVIKGGFQENIVIYDWINKSETVFPTQSDIKNIQWSYDESLLYITSAIGSQKYQLSILNRNDSSIQMHKLTEINGMHTAISVNPVTGNIAFDYYTARQQLLVIDMDTGDVDYSRESSFKDEQPAINSSSKQLSFVSNRSGQEGVWLEELGESKIAPKELFSKNTFFGGLAWMDDGESLIYSAILDREYILYSYNLSSGKHTKLNIDMENIVFPTIGQHSQQLLFTHFYNNQSDSYQYDFTTKKYSLVQNNARVLKESPTGQWYYYCIPDKNGIWRKSLSTGEAELFIENLDANDFGNWTITHDGIIYLDRSNDQLTIKSVDFNNQEINKPIELHTFPRIGVLNFSYNQKNHQLLLATNDNFEGNIKLLSFKGK